MSVAGGVHVVKHFIGVFFCPSAYVAFRVREGEVSKECHLHVR